MIDRSLVTRAFIALFVLAAIGAVAYASFSDTDGRSGNYVEATAYGPIFEDPAAFRSRVLGDPWVNAIPLRAGGTFSRSIVRQVRIDIDGSGPVTSRDVTLETPPAVELFAGARRERAEGVLHGIQAILEERGGLIRGLALTDGRAGFEAAAIADYVELRMTDGVTDRGEQAEITRILRDIGTDQADHTFAWYTGDVQQIVLGPEISSGLLRWIRTPGRTKPATNLFTAYVLRHELEHAVTPSTGDPRKLKWVEEGTADTIARWPGAAAATAKALGMPYPRRYDRQQYSTRRGGYPEWTNTVRVLLGAAGVDWRDAEALDEATELLQGEGTAEVPGVLAERIGLRNQMGPLEVRRLEARIRALDGSTRAARRLVAQL